MPAEGERLLSSGGKAGATASGAAAARQAKAMKEAAAAARRAKGNSNSVMVKEAEKAALRITELLPAVLRILAREGFCHNRKDECCSAGASLSGGGILSEQATALGPEALIRYSGAYIWSAALQTCPSAAF